MKYHLTALGNALVDLEYTVSPSFFKQENIEKGVMTLIDKSQHKSLLDALEPAHPIRKKACGGSAANTVVTAAQYGAQTFYCCKVGDDHFGKFYKEDLANSNVHHKLAEQNDSGETGKCIVMVTEDADRTMNTYLGITAEFGLNEVCEQAIKDSEYLYIEGHLVYSPQAVQAILHAKRIARENGVKVALTVSDPAVIKYVREHIDEVIGSDGVDLLFCNTEEATDYGHGDLEAGIAAFRKICPHVVVTSGAEGATIYLNGDAGIKVPAFKVEAIDTTGAGDTFAGAYLYAITHGFSTVAAGELANKTASECVAHFGPRLSTEKQASIMNVLRKTA